MEGGYIGVALSLGAPSYFVDWSAEQEILKTGQFALCTSTENGVLAS